MLLTRLLCGTSFLIILQTLPVVSGVLLAGSSTSCGCVPGAPLLFKKIRLRPGVTADYRRQARLAWARGRRWRCHARGDPCRTVLLQVDNGV